MSQSESDLKPTGIPGVQKVPVARILGPVAAVIATMAVGGFLLFRPMLGSSRLPGVSPVASTPALPSPSATPLVPAPLVSATDEVSVFPAPVTAPSVTANVSASAAPSPTRPQGPAGGSKPRPSNHKPTTRSGPKASAPDIDLR